MTDINSLAAFGFVRAKLHECQEPVFEYIADHPGSCNYEIAKALNLDINRVTPRVLELRELKLVYFAGPKISPTGNTAKSWKAVEWARKYASGRSMPAAPAKPAADQMNIPGLVNSWDF